VTCIAVGLLLALTLPVACLLLVVIYSEGQSKKRDRVTDALYGDDAEAPREFRGLTGRMRK